MPFFLLHTPLQNIMLHLLVTSLRFLLHVTFLMLSSYWMDFPVLRWTLQLSCRMPPYWNSSVFLVICLELQIFRRNITGKVLLSSHPIKGTWFVFVNVDLKPAGSLCYGVRPCPHCTLEEHHWAQPSIQWEDVLPYFKVECLCNSFWIPLQRA